MASKKQSALSLLNTYFYNTYHKSFDSTRQKPWDGWLKLSKELLQAKYIMDIGCGNGRLRKYLSSIGYTGRYIGTDVNNELLAYTEDLLDNNTQFFQCDAIESYSYSQIQHVDCTTCFGVLHHIGTEKYLIKLLDQAYHHSTQFILSRWNCIMNTKLMQKRIDPLLSEAGEYLKQFGIDPTTFDSSDYLFSWSDTVGALRYVRYWSDDQLIPLFHKMGWSIHKTFLDDGANGMENTYFVLQKTDPALRTHLHII